MASVPRPPCPARGVFKASTFPARGASLYSPRSASMANPVTLSRFESILLLTLHSLFPWVGQQFDLLQQFRPRSGLLSQSSEPDSLSPPRSAATASRFPLTALLPPLLLVVTASQPPLVALSPPPGLEIPPVYSHLLGNTTSTRL